MAALLLLSLKGLLPRLAVCSGAKQDGEVGVSPPISIVIVSADHDTNSITRTETLPLLKSILRQASCSLDFIFVVNPASSELLSEFFGKIKTPAHPISFTLVDLPEQGILSQLVRSSTQQRPLPAAFACGPFGVTASILEIGHSVLAVARTPAKFDSCLLVPFEILISHPCEPPHPTPPNPPKWPRQFATPA